MRHTISIDPEKFRETYQMVDAIAPISASAASSATQADRSNSITSEPDNKWVATRQSKIDQDQVALKQANAELEADIARFGGHADDEMEVFPEGHSSERNHHRSPTNGEAVDGDTQPTLSGESDEIGTVNFDENTPFGHRTAIV